MPSAYLKFVTTLPPMPIPPSHLSKAYIIIFSAKMLNNKGRATLSPHFPDVELFRLSKLCFDCRFLICVLQDDLHSLVIYTVELILVVNETHINILLMFSSSFHHPSNFGNVIGVPAHIVTRFSAVSVAIVATRRSITPNITITRCVADQ